MAIPLYKMSKDELEKILKGRINGEFEEEGNQKLLKIIHELIKPILDRHGIYGYDRGKYHGFAQSLYYRIRKKSGIEAVRIAEMRISYFKHVHRLSEEILKEIAQTIVSFLFPF